MKIRDYLNQEIHLPTSGGKAGKGFQKTSTIQCRKGNRITKQFRFIMGDLASRSKALNKAMAYIAEAAATPSTE